MRVLRKFATGLSTIVNLLTCLQLLTGPIICGLKNVRQSCNERWRSGRWSLEIGLAIGNALGQSWIVTPLALAWLSSLTTSMAKLLQLWSNVQTVCCISWSRGAALVWCSLTVNLIFITCWRPWKPQVLAPVDSRAFLRLWRSAGLSFSWKIFTYWARARDAEEQ